MAKVSNLVIKLQSGTENTHYATWDFVETTTITVPAGGVKVGAYVTIKPGARYYNGVAIPSWVMSDKWKIIEISGTRAVLGRNESGSHNIMSPIHTSNLVGTGGSTSTTKTTNYLDHYEVKWYYYTGDGVWFADNSSNVTGKQATYNAPSNASSIKVSVKPVSKTKTQNGTETAYWTGTPVTATYSIEVNPPEKPPSPSIKIDKYTLTATVNNVSDPRTDQISFEVYNGTKLIKTGIGNVVTCRASFSCTISAGGDYRVRCRSINLNGSRKIYGEYTDFTASEKAIPAKPNKMTICRASSETSVYLEWVVVNTAESYDIEYTTKINYFDGSDQTTTISNIEFNHYEKTGLESGQEYFFRLRAVNEKGASAWSDITSVVIGDTPAAPTTWSSATTVITGESLNLYWVHNAKDGSSQTYGELELYVNGVKETYTIKNSEDEDLKDKTSVYSVDTTEYPEGTTIQWRVRTAGITLAYGEWSVQRTIDIYAPPTLELEMKDIDGNLIDTLTEFPFYIHGLAGPNTQMPIGYHLTITSSEGYETVDYIGNKKIINPGEPVYNKYFDTNEPLVVEFTPGNVDLENNIVYTITCVVSMNSGLTTTSSLNFTVSWTDKGYEPDASIAIDDETFVAYITPYCKDVNGNIVNEVTLSVYRREFDGTFTELATGLDPLNNVVITDPHPSLDYARYRIVSITNNTGAVSYYDPPGYPVNGKAVIIQWDEEWIPFDSTNEDRMEQSPWAGSMLKIPYNIDVSDNNKLDASIVSYIGRRYPVSYYGTNVDSTATWSMVIPKEDEETLYGLRRLSLWSGDVYVREPSGSGYWANITVSFSQKHLDVTIPISLSITRVDGGI